jgi:hypothetical protein
MFVTRCARPIWAPAISLLSACTELPPPEVHPDLLKQADFAVDTSPLDVVGGTMRLGEDAQITVSMAPPNGVVDLYLSRFGEGPSDCLTFAPLCLDLIAPELYATKTANMAGSTVFTIDADDFTDTQELAWQAASTQAMGQTTVVDNVEIRHVVIPIADAAVAMTPVTLISGVGPLLTHGNTHTGGAVWIDYNNDLWTDLFVVNGSGNQNALYRNDGDGTFTKILNALDKPDLLMEPACAKYADVDGDHDLDIFVPVDNADQMISWQPQDHLGGPNLLFLNDHGTFTESAATSGLLDPRGWRNSDAAFADYDLDGCIDVYVGNWAMSAIPANDNFSRMMRGNCDGTFDEVTATTGTDGSGRDTLVTFWWDANMDGLPDLYSGNVAHGVMLPDYDPTANFYYNLDGVSFEDQVPVLQPYLGLDAWAAMGADVADIDHDGDWDLYITDSFQIGTPPHGNPLYLGNPDGTMTANVCGEHSACGGYNSWPANFADFNRDTWSDLWIGSSNDDELTLLYLNKGDGTFEHHEQVDFGGLVSRGGSVSDYDGDGDVDVFLWANDGASQLYQNNPVDENHWVEVKLYGTESTWDAIGATVFVTSGGVRQMRRVSGGDSAHSQMDAILHFGLADVATIDLLEVEWPTGTRQAFANVPVDDLLRIDETDGLLTEELRRGGAEYNPQRQTLMVHTRSTWGGRTVVHVEGFGQLRYDAETRSHAHKFRGVTTMPATVRVSTERGATVDVPVVEIP